MKPSPAPHDPWARLVAAARRAPATELPELPAGFATRLAALGLAATERPTFGTLVDFFSWRALATAAALVAVTSSFTLPGVVAHARTAEPAVAAEFVDPVAELLDLS